VCVFVYICIHIDIPRPDIQVRYAEPFVLLPKEHVSALCLPKYLFLSKYLFRCVFGARLPREEKALSDAKALSALGDSSSPLHIHI